MGDYVLIIVAAHDGKANTQVFNSKFCLPQRR